LQLPDTQQRIHLRHKKKGNMRTLTAIEKWSYAIGNMPFAVKDAAFIHFVVFYYTQVQGISGSLAGLAMFIAISWDAISDPIVGSWSDTFKSRWGRRHPLILVGGLGTAALFIALFSPPSGLSETGVFLWLTGVAMLLRTFLTLNFIPYSAMGAELSTDYDERTVIAKARVTMAWLAGMLLPALAFLLIFQSRGSGTDGRLLIENYHVYGWLSALLAAVATLICVWGTRTVIARLPRAERDRPDFGLSQTLIDFRSAFRNRNFRISLGANLAFGMAVGVYSTLSLYLGTYFWEFSTDQLAGLVVPTAIGTLMAFALMGGASRRFDKPTLLSAACLAIGVNVLWFVGGRLLGVLPDNGTELIYALQWINTLIGVYIVVTLQIVIISLLADILDEHELDTGRRQEGVFFAAGTFIAKTTTGVGALLAGIVIDIAGITAGSEPGEIATGSLAVLGWFYLGITTSLALIAWYFADKIHLNRADHERIRVALADRGSSQAT
jgi:GPH family glycoside/pentoside/hexuronide:cation symporter